MQDFVDPRLPEVRRRGAGEEMSENVDETYDPRSRLNTIPRWSERAGKFGTIVVKFTTCIPYVKT